MARFSKAALSLLLLVDVANSWNIAPTQQGFRSTTSLSVSPNNAWNQASKSLESIESKLLSGSSTPVDSAPTLPSSPITPESISEPLSTIKNIISDPETVIKPIQSIISDLNIKLLQILDKDFNLETVKATIQASIIPYLDTIPTPVAIVLSAGITYSVLTSLFNWNSGPPPSSPYPLKRYDAATARAFFDSRLDLVILRSLQLTVLSAKFGINIGLDYLKKELDKNADTRARELTILLTTLGPSFIKIGQSLSIRTDLLSPAYVRGLKSLQDQVPAFSSQEAYAIIEEDLGMNVDEIFESIGKEPVAAASLGQVYKGVLKSNGKTVAIKVQRPDIMNQIALDMHLIREIGAVLKRTFNLNTDLVGTVDTWGIGFVDELNYYDEAANAIRFTESMQTTPLADVVFSPPVIEELTSERVLVTEWVDGERLDKSDQKDVTVLCSIAMNTYLTMMLETGLLHCDPHPGNLLRTKDGRLCILDWGMVTRLEPNLQITLIEHMAHLTSADYAEIPKDLLELGFIPLDKADLIEDSGVVETLAEIYGAWTSGGGAAAINVNKVVAQLQDLTAEKGNLFQIPPYFAYIAKSFSVLEGIGLSNDAKYSIINECLPYVSKRLLTDKNERTGGALGTFIFGADKNDIEKRIVSYDRVEQLVTGFGDYSTSASGALLGKEDVPRVQLFEETADQILNLVITEEETPLQGILIEQLAKIISSSSRSLWNDIRERSGKLPSGRSVLGTIVDPLGLWRTSPIVRMNELDIKTVDTTRDLMTLIQNQNTSSNMFDFENMSNEEVVEFSQILVSKLWEKRRGVALTGGRLANMLVKITADKLERGERDLMILPEANDIEMNDGETVEANINIVPQPVRSSRLDNARQLLAKLEKEVQ